MRAPVNGACPFGHYTRAPRSGMIPTTSPRQPPSTTVMFDLIIKNGTVIDGTGADERIADIAIAVGACSATAQRLRQVETRLAGRPADASALETVDPDDFIELSPIDDIRADAGFRRDAAVEIVRRAVAECLGCTW